MIRIAIYVRANARRPLVGGSYSGCLVVKVSAPASEGAANSAVTEALAQAFSVSKRSVRILQGRKSPRKIVTIDIAEATGGDLLERLLNPRDRPGST